MLLALCMRFCLAHGCWVEALNLRESWRSIPARIPMLLINWPLCAAQGESRLPAV